MSTNVSEYFKQNLLTHGMQWLYQWEDDTRENAPEILAALKLSGLGEQVRECAFMARTCVTQRAEVYARNAVLPPNGLLRYSGFPENDHATAMKLRRAVVSDCVRALGQARSNIEQLFVSAGLPADDAGEAAGAVVVSYVKGLIEKYGSASYGDSLITELEMFIRRSLS